MPSAANAASCAAGAGLGEHARHGAHRRLELRLQRAHVGAVGDLHRASCTSTRGSASDEFSTRCVISISFGTIASRPPSERITV